MRPTYSRRVEAALTPNLGWEVQSFEYYAAHFLVGSKLTTGDLESNIRSLAYEMKKQYDIGVAHGRNSPSIFTATKESE